jgi:hypothetical protein
MGHIHGDHVCGSGRLVESGSQERTGEKGTLAPPVLTTTCALSSGLSFFLRLSCFSFFTSCSNSLPAECASSQHHEWVEWGGVVFLVSYIVSYIVSYERTLAHLSLVVRWSGIGG